MRTTITVLAALTQITAALGQPTATWTQVQTASPGARYGHSMSFDRARDRAIIYAGVPGLTDVWELQSNIWQSLGSGPGIRSEAFMVYDEVRHVTVLFGGNLGGSYTDDLYEYDGATWQRKFPNYSPPPMLEHRMWFDDLAGKVYLYGGAANGQLASAVWTWDGSRWRIVSTTAPKLMYPAIAYDRARHVAVLFGGYQDGYRAETWEFDGFHWQQRFPLLSPPARYLNVAAYHEGLGRVVMHGGAPNLGDTWEWDGANWIAGNAHGRTSPGLRYHSTMAYDNIRERCLLFGGYNGTSQTGDTWAYQLPAEMEAGDFTVEVGTLVAGDLDALRDPEDQALTCSVSPDSCQIQVQFASILFSPLPIGQLWFQIEASASQPGILTVELYNFASAHWDTLAQAMVTETDSVLWAGVESNGNAYKGPFSLTLARARLDPTADDVCTLMLAIDHVAWHMSN